MKSPLTIVFIAGVINVMGAGYWPAGAADSVKETADGSRIASTTPQSAPVICPPGADSAYYLAGQYVVSGRYDEAISYFDQAIKLASVGTAHFRIADAFYSKGNANVYLGKSTEALADYTRAVGLDSKFALAYYMRGQVYESRKDHQKAISDFKKATELDQKFALAYGGLASAYHGTGENERAVEYASNSISLDPRNAWFYDTRAKANWELGQFDKYVDDISREIVLLTAGSSGAGLDQQHADLLAPAYYSRAQAYQKLGKNDLAQRDLDKAKELGYKAESKPAGAS